MAGPNDERDKAKETHVDANKTPGDTAKAIFLLKAAGDTVSPTA